MTTYILLAATIYSLKINVYLHRDQHNPRHDHWSLIREMRCLRNKIHANLFLTFVLDCTFWMATDILQGRELPTTGLKVPLLLNSLKNVRAYYQGGGVSFTVKYTIRMCELTFQYQCHGVQCICKQLQCLTFWWENAFASLIHLLHLRWHLHLHLK